MTSWTAQPRIGAGTTSPDRVPDRIPDGALDLAAPLSPELEAAAQRFAAALHPARSVAVAFSGGVDSSVTVALAVRALGADRVVAVLGVSASLASTERVSAHDTAAALGVRLLEVTTRELQDPAYVANDGDRCYFCKHELYTTVVSEVLVGAKSEAMSEAMSEALAREGIDLLVNGDTADDVVRADRPGRRAAAEHGVRSPLADAGMGKQQVRGTARALGLPVWDKPSSPCLASRLGTRIPVTLGRLAQVERAEAALHRLGLRELRVRHLGGTARVELAPAGHAALIDPGLHTAVLDAVRDAGYATVEIDPRPLVRD
ncbi:ATP-dependent sacrificial sulfur transferase LarE [Nakamurella leprariae]|uniref:ATP-dependent sacrificial sulfur transferase LarE n=1 Tax=Nakamurella leprariae TaxID=2803911 RepID=A0A938YHZ0_9ACTN|nr:ATP-dependent sacrificial sulfur transferase LarE [Nakamurella leprariae]MBM9468140.1 ATP-dependent sacrificial sulfur transferase LarE [Nakamurella leprariae]